MKVKIVSALLAITMIFLCGNVTVFALEDKEAYTRETEEVLFTEYQQENVEITTLPMEVDMLAEIEAFFMCSEDELLAMGATKEKIDKTREELLYYYGLRDSDLADKLKINKTEASMFKKAIEAGLKSNGKKCTNKNSVSASGSITSSEMKYTQKVTNNSTLTNPSYGVQLSYEWKEVYELAVLDDKIAVAWGGGLNLKNFSSSVLYYDWKDIGGSFGKYYTRRSMTKEETIQAGVELEFPQSVYKDFLSPMPKTKDGYAQFTLYQTKFQGYDTKVISRYCHKVISIGGGSIEISVAGPAVSLDVGYGYDKTAQAETTIGY